jgi:hypothetical protein
MRESMWKWGKRLTKRRGSALTLALVFGFAGGATPTHAKEIENPPTVSGAYWRSGLHTVLPILGGSVLASQGGMTPLVGTLAITYGAFVGPSMGNFYVEDEVGGLGGIGWRLGGAATTLVGFAMAIGCALNGDGECNANEGLIWISIIGGAAAYTGGTIWHLLRIPEKVRSHSSATENARHHPALAWSLSPTWEPTRQAFGAQLALQLSAW